MSDLIEFENFTVSRAHRQLFSDGHPVAISSPGMRLLLALMDRPGSVLTKNELIAQVWGSSFVTENALHVQIAALRKAIGNHLIITQSGVGYRFVGARRTEAPPAPPKEKLACIRSLIGRDLQLRDMTRLIQRYRFITLSGPGGVGKTSLARAFADNHAAVFRDGTCFVEAAAQQDEAGLINAINFALKREGSFDKPPLADLVAYLQPRALLLVLDNCEQLLAGASHVAEALYCGAPGLGIIATSRQALACTGEQVLAVPPLRVPTASGQSVSDMRRSPSCQLFTERIAALDPDFRATDDQMPIVSRICRRLDGLPLALEIVASWASLLGLETVEDKLKAAHIGWVHARMTAPARHHSLRNTLSWSNDLLSVSERVLLRRLAVFAHAFTLVAAEPIASNADLPAEQIFTHLAGLIQKSLVAMAAGSKPPAYRLLETTRAFALEKLQEAGEESETRARHAHTVLAALIDAEGHWDQLGGDPWLARFGHLIADVRGALEWALERRADIGTGMAIAAAAWPLWRELSLRVEGAPWFDLALRLMPPETPPEMEAQLRFGLAMMHSDGDWQLARAAFDRAASLYRQLGDRYRLGRTLQHLAFTLFLLGDPAGAETMADDARQLLQGSSSGRALAAIYVIQLVLLSERRDYQGADASGRHAVRLYEAMGAERSAFSARSNLLDIALCQNDVTRAVADGQTLVAQLRGSPHIGVLAAVLVNVVAALVRAGSFAPALDAALEAAPLLPEKNRRLIVLLDHLALRCAMMGRLVDAALIAGFADRAYAERGHPRQHVEEAASQHLSKLLRAALTPPDLTRLQQDGAFLVESAAWSIATTQPGAHTLGLAANG